MIDSHWATYQLIHMIYELAQNNPKRTGQKGTKEDKKGHKSTRNVAKNLDILKFQLPKSFLFIMKIFLSLFVL